MIDFHSHVLPGIDDGAADIDMSRGMLNISIDEGVDSICATPHFIAGEYEIERQCYEEHLSKLNKNIGDNSIKIIPGLEVYINPDIVELYKNQKIWGINYSKYMLVEFPMREIPIYADKVLYQLRLEGVIPIIAHPERNLSIIKNMGLLINLVEQGNLAQLNAGSLRGIYGSEIRKTAVKLVEMNLIHMLGSDGHNCNSRPTKIKDGFQQIENINGKLGRWISENQGKILKGEEIEPLEIRTLKKSKKSFWKFFNRA